MSKKKMKKKLGKKVGTCLQCGDWLRERMADCAKCGKASPLFQAKAGKPYLVKTPGAVPFLVKSGSKVVPIGAGQRFCFGCHSPVKRSHKYCHTCTAPLASKAAHAEWVQKRARPGGDTVLGERFARETDPTRSEDTYKAIRAQAGGAVAMMTKTMGGQRGLYEAWRNESDPAKAEVYWRALHPELYGDGNGAA